MQITNITFENTSTNKSKNKITEVAKTAGVIAGTTAVSIGAFYLKDLFTGKKDYNEKKKEVYKTFYEKIEEKVKANIKKVESWGETVDQGYEDAMRESATRYLKREYLNDKLTLLKRNRLADLRSGVRLAAGIGLAISPFVLMARNHVKKKYGENAYNNKVSKIAKTTGTVTGVTAGTMAVSAGTFSLYNYFANKKKYQDKVENAHNTYHKKIEEWIADEIDAMESACKKVTQEHIDATRNEATTLLKKDLNKKLKALKKDRLDDLFRSLKKSIWVGLALSPIVLLARNYIKKNDAQNSQTQIAQTPFNIVEKNSNNTFQNNNLNTVAKTKVTTNPQMANIKNSTFRNFSNISFRGIIDEVAEELTYDEINTCREYIKGQYPNYEELEQAKRIAKMKSPYSFYTDREWRFLTLKNEIDVPNKPPKYYRNYQKLFNTKGYQEHLKWPEYFEKSLKYERRCNILDKVVQENIAAEKLALEKVAKKQISLAYTKYLLSKNFVIDFNSTSKDKHIPNAILIEGKNSADREETIKWLIGKINGNYIFVPHNNESNETKLNQVLTALEKAKENFESNQKPTFIWVENFENLLYNTEANEEIIVDLKDLLCKISKEYNATIIFDTSNSKNLAPIALQQHRVNLKIDLDREIQNEEFKKLKEEYLLANVEKLPYNGYKFPCSPMQDDYAVLYRGGLGYNSNILWIDSSDASKIQSVIENIDTVKKLPWFEFVTKAEFPKPNENLQISSSIYATGDLTKEGKAIYYLYI